MALHPQALTTPARLRAWLTQQAVGEVSGRFADEPLSELINRASGAIEAWCDRILVAPPTDQTYRLDGHGHALLVLPQWPIAALTALRIDGETIPERTAGVGAGYAARRAEAWLELVGHRFTPGRQNVEVVGRLGYDATLAATDRHHRRALDDLEQACLLLAGGWFARGAPAAGQPATSQPWPSEIAPLLAPYRRLGA